MHMNLLVNGQHINHHKMPQITQFSLKLPPPSFKTTMEKVKERWDFLIVFDDCHYDVNSNFIVKWSIMLSRSATKYYSRNGSTLNTVLAEF
jgi:hypothetical protein